MRHREVDAADTRAFRGGRQPTGELHRRLGPADDLDLVPREGSRDAEAECLADGLLAGEAPRVALGGIGARLAVRLLGRREAPVSEPGIPVERAPDARDLDQIR